MPLPEKTAAGNEDLGLSGQFLVEAPVAWIGDCIGHRMGGPSLALDANTPVQRGNEITVNERFTRIAAGVQPLVEV